MSTSKNDILQGTLTLLVLKTLASNRRMHGYAITTHVQRVSADLLRVELRMQLPQGGAAPVRAEHQQAERDRQRG